MYSILSKGALSIKCVLYLLPSGAKCVLCIRHYCIYMSNARAFIEFHVECKDGTFISPAQGQLFMLAPASHRSGSGTFSEYLTR
jgi:hypothetical protein